MRKDYNKIGSSYGGPFLNVPERWLHCPRRSRQLIGDVFIATKTFLDSRYDTKVAPAFYFKPEMIKDIERNVGLEIGLVIDLTLSKRFYDPNVMESLGLIYIKIACSGKDETPTSEQVVRFVTACKVFLQRNPTRKILVHCTHGFNRTGFMILSYLIQEQGCDLKSALEHFATCRPPGIYKKSYIDKIISIYEVDGESIDFETPELPEWCYLDDRSTTNFVQSISLSTEANDAKMSHVKFPLEDSFIVSIISPDLLSSIQADVLKFFDSHISHFPGSQPVSLSKENISLIVDHPYLVSWKADGTRFLMYIKDKYQTFMVDREFNVFHIPSLTFPDKDSLNNHIKETLLDGELIFEKDGQILRPRFLIFDAIIIKGEDCGPLFSKRLEMIHTEIIKPRDDQISKGVINRSKEPFSVRRKEFFDKSQTVWLIEKFTRKITHETDGVVFQPENERYKSGVWDTVLKWKPEHLNSIDFYLDIRETQHEGCLREKVGNLYVLRMGHPFATITVTSELKKLNNKIIECTFDRKCGWKLLRERPDKTQPNALNTAINVFKTIKNPVTKSDLYSALGLTHVYEALLSQMQKQTPDVQSSTASLNV